jgi:hypothetical protein
VVELLADLATQESTRPISERVAVAVEQEQPLSIMMAVMVPTAL